MVSLSGRIAPPCTISNATACMYVRHSPLSVSVLYPVLRYVSYHVLYRVGSVPFNHQVDSNYVFSVPARQPHGKFPSICSRADLHLSLTVRQWPYGLLYANRS